MASLEDLTKSYVGPFKLLCIDNPRTMQWQLQLTQLAAHRVWEEWCKRHNPPFGEHFDQEKFDAAMRRLYQQLFENEVFLSGAKRGLDK